MTFNIKTGIYGLRDMDNGDIHYMLNIDRKFSEFPWSFGGWQKLVTDFPDWRINVVTIKDQVCGFCIWEIKKDSVQIHRFCYDQKLADFMIDTMLLDTLVSYALKNGKNILEYIVRETSCRGGDDIYDKSAWLLKHDFLCVAINRNQFEGYGEKADGYVFQRKIKKSLDNQDKSEYNE